MNQPYVDRTFLLNTTYLDKFKELISDLSIEVKKNHDAKKKDFIVKPRAPGVYPAIILVHDWWGLDDHARMVAMRFAKEGFIVLAPSLYRGEMTARADVARHLMRYLTPDDAYNVILEGYRQLVNMPDVAKERIGIIGFQMGGYHALQAAVNMKVFGAASAFYGRFPKSIVEDLMHINCPVLFFTGGSEDWFEQEEIKAMEKGFAEHKMNARVQKYDHVGLSFFDDLHMEGYDYISAENAWNHAVQFFKGNLKEKKLATFPRMRKWVGPAMGGLVDWIEKSPMGAKILSLFEEAFGDEMPEQKKN